MAEIKSTFEFEDIESGTVQLMCGAKVLKMFQPEAKGKLDISLMIIEQEEEKEEEAEEEKE